MENTVVVTGEGEEETDEDGGLRDAKIRPDRIDDLPEEEQEDQKSKKMVTTKKNKQDQSSVVVCRCTLADLLKMTIEYALTVIGTDKQFKVPTVELPQEMVAEKQMSFSSKKTEELITDVVNSRFHDKLPPKLGLGIPIQTNAQ